MRQIVFVTLIGFIAVTFSSCKVLPPVYKGIQQSQLEGVGLSGIRFKAQVAFYNPNRMKCKIRDVAMNIMLDDKQVATIGDSSEIIIGKKTDFMIPVAVTINPQGTIFENIMTIVDFFGDKESTLTLQGNVKIKVLGITFPVPIKYQQKIKIRELKN
jgi:LEA14-like dessication related protein